MWCDRRHHDSALHVPHRFRPCRPRHRGACGERSEFLPPGKVNILLGDSSKVHKALGWAPQISLDQLIREMVDNDVERLKQGRGIAAG
ncbi:GDP-mannose 4,6-dehydratase [Methylocystis sp. JR02]|uniref:GDP-mannose 4,6-dehydratase n=1 Tax=Methylocystis sp. JR02 TaxID=3046284 RepID=UPI0024BB16F9|nr:GDP-mannose 4,6-dehydratase [Methylocystis sp. JR02]MDJ0447117.1 GDP-mannose 4,6-dehydratase [Methylocystis sp. JR02]